MKLVLTILMLIGSTHLTANAQQIDDSLDLDLDPALTEEINAETGKIEEKKPQNGPSIKADAKQNRSIYIVNQSSSGAKADSKNKNELVDSETITNSRADELRKSRKRAELETELKATEKIEESRLKDEQKRSDVLFSERFKALDNNENTNQNTNTNQVPVQVIAPQQNVNPSTPALSREDLKEELKSVLDEKEVLESQKAKHKNNGSYFIGMVGLSEYPKADNIQGNGVFGFGLGVEVQDKVLVEGLFQYASYKSNFIWLKDIEEYSAIGAIKAQFSKSMIRPIAGGLIAYSYRTYTDTYANNQNPYAYQTSSQTHVSAFDIGLLGGAQFVISDDFSIGGEFRYLWNLTSKTDGAYYPAFFPNSQPLDQMSHYSFLLTGRINF